MQLAAIPYILALGFLFGSTVVASRFSVGQFDPFVYIALRLTIVSVIYILIYISKKGELRWPKGKNLWLHASIFGLFGSTLTMIFIVNALRYLSSGVASTLIAANPAITVVFAHIFLPDERLSWRKGIGVLLAIGGAALLALRGESGLPDITQADPIGYLLVAGGLLAATTSMIHSRKYLKNYDTFEVASVRIFSATIFTLPLALLFGDFDFSPVNYQGVAALGYASLIGTFLGFLLQFTIIKRFGATTAVMSGYINPIVANLGGALILSEVITTAMLGGMAVIFIGIYLVNQRARSAPVLAQP